MTLRYIDKNTQASELALPGTKTKDFDWRLSLKVGDEVDACDISQVWYNSTILAIRETPISDDRKYTEIKIGKIFFQ
jgi:hypothetical protein